MDKFFQDKYYHHKSFRFKCFKTQGCHYKLTAGGNLPVVGPVCAGYSAGNVSQILESFERKLSFRAPTSSKKHFYVV